MCSIALRSNYLAFHRIWAHKVFVEIIHYTQKFWTFFAGLIALLGMVGLKVFQSCYGEASDVLLGLLGFLSAISHKTYFKFLRRAFRNF